MDKHTIDLGNDRYIELPEEVAEKVQEFDWTWCEKLSQAVRKGEGDHVIPLYHEVLACGLDVDEDSEVLTWATLGEDEIYAMVGHSFEYSLLKNQWFQVFMHTTKILHLDFPDMHDWIGVAITAALKSYFDWQNRGTRYVFEPDEDYLTPGRLVNTPMEYTSYRTLGQWMDNEFSGDWENDPEHPVGIAPALCGEEVEMTTFNAMGLLFEDLDVNEGIDYPAYADTINRETKGMLDDLLFTGTALLEHYPLILRDADC